MLQLRLTEAGIKYIADFIKEAMINVFPDFFNYLSTEYKVSKNEIVEAASFELQDPFSFPIDSISDLPLRNDPAGVLESFYIVCKLDKSDVPLHIASLALNNTIFSGKPLPLVPNYAYTADVGKDTHVNMSGEIDWQTSEFFIYVSTFVLHPEHYEEN